MSEARSRRITSNQSGPHEEVPALVARYWQSEFRKPVADHSREAFAQVAQRVQEWDGPLIMDSCCGVGESSLRIAEEHPDALVIGVDKSAHRIGKFTGMEPHHEPTNLIIVRADLNDFWRLAEGAGWRLAHHYLLYPNPWPKKKHVGRRWHGAPVFPALVNLGGQLHMRTNWPLYLQEMQIALRTLQIDSEIVALAFQAHPFTPFERKYQASGQPLWALNARLDHPKLASIEQREALRKLAESTGDMLKSPARKNRPGESCGA